MENMQPWHTVNSEVEAVEFSFTPDLYFSEPLPFGSPAPDITYNQSPSCHFNASSPLEAIDGISDWESLDFAANIDGVDYDNTADASNDLVPLANNTERTVTECGHHQQIGTGNGLYPSSQSQEINGYENNIQMKQPLLTPHSVPQVTAGDSVIGSQDDSNSLDASNDLVPLANNRQMTVTEYGLHQNISTGNGLYPSSQSQEINGSENNLIQINQPLMTPCSIPPVSADVQNNSGTPSMPTVPASWADSQVKNVMRTQIAENMNSGSGPYIQLQSFNEAPNNVVFQQHSDVAPILSQVDPAGISVGASKHQTLEYNHESPGTADSLASLADETKEAGPEPQPDQHEDKSSNGSGTIPLTVPRFVVEIPKSLPFDCWKGEILKKMEVVIDSVLDNIRINISIPGNVTIRKERAISRPCQQQRRSRRRFSLDETKFLIDAVDKHGIGGWQEIKENFFHTSDRTCNDLKDKWRSLVNTASKPAATRRGPVVPKDLLHKVIYIARRNANLQGKPL